MGSLIQSVKLKFFILVLLILLPFFYACSWQEVFAIMNNCEKELLVEYSIEYPVKGFPIFSNTPSIYKIKKNGRIDYGNIIEVQDMDTSYAKIKLNIPPKCALVFGVLSNDHYEKFNQYFINGRKFNLIQMQINQKDAPLIIKPETFDTFFKKDKGVISWMSKKNNM